MVISNIMELTYILVISFLVFILLSFFYVAGHYQTSFHPQKVSPVSGYPPLGASPQHHKEGKEGFTEKTPFQAQPSSFTPSPSIKSIKYTGVPHPRPFASENTPPLLKHQPTNSSIFVVDDKNLSFN